MRLVNLTPKNFKLSKSLIGVLILYAPIPMGLRLEDLSYLAILGIAWLSFNGLISLQGWRTPAIFLITTSIAALFSAIRGAEFSEFQYLRGSVFPLLLVLLLTTKISDKFFNTLENSLSLLILGSCASGILYFGLGSNLYNSSLEIPYEAALYKRLFVFPIYLFLILFVDSAVKGKASQIVYAALIIASGSKAIMLSVLLVYGFILVKPKFKRQMLQSLSGILLVLIAGFLSGIFDRVSDFLSEGDPWRVLEPLAAVENLRDPIRFIIGNGSGIPYWDGRMISGMDSGETLRVIQNSRFDVHNGFLAIALKFGVPLTGLFIWILFKACKQSSAGVLLFTVLCLNVYLSHGPVQVVEAVGLALGLRLIIYRDISSAKKRQMLSYPSTQ